MTSPINESELKALISLTDEPDENIFIEITDKILLYGTAAIPLLEDRWENCFDTIAQQRILNIIHKIQYDSTKIELNNWAKFHSSDLFEAYLIVSRYQYHEIKKEEIERKINEISHNIWLELNDGLTALEKIKVVNHIFYDVHGFTGNADDFHSPQNSYINTLLESRRGNPLSLGMLYIIISRQLNIPVYGVNLPEHFVLAYTNELPEEKLGFLESDAALFYINPFSKGAVFSKKEAELFIKQLKIEPQESFFKPCTNIDIIRRLINNLIFLYDKMDDAEKVKELEVLMKMLDV